MRALRFAGTFTCQHLPWLRSFTLPREEQEFYRKTNAHSYYLPNADAGPPRHHQWKTPLGDFEPADKDPVQPQ
jgi:hypothetical protein